MKRNCRYRLPAPLLVLLLSWPAATFAAGGDFIARGLAVSADKAHVQREAQYVLTTRIIDQLGLRSRQHFSLPADFPPLPAPSVEIRGNAGKLQFHARLSREKLLSSYKVAFTRMQTTPAANEQNTVKALVRDDQLRRYARYINAMDPRANARVERRSDLLKAAFSGLRGSPSLREAAASAMKQLGARVKGRIFLYAPVAGGGGNQQAVSEMAAYLFEIHAQGLGERLTKDIMGADAYIWGEYLEQDGTMELIWYLRDASHQTLGATLARAPIPTVSRPETSKTDSDFVGSLYRGLIRVTADVPPSATPTALAGMDRQNTEFAVDIRTERGKDRLFYREGQTGSLFVKLDQPGYFYIVGYISKPSGRYSYLLPLNNKRDAERFIMKVDAGQAGRWLSLGGFDIAPPFGVEALQIMASSEPMAQMLPPSKYDMRHGLYIVDGAPEMVLGKTRGLVRVTVKQGAEAENVPARSPASVAEAVLHFTTMSQLQ